MRGQLQRRRNFRAGQLHTEDPAALIANGCVYSYLRPRLSVRFGSVLHVIRLRPLPELSIGKTERACRYLRVPERPLKTLGIERGPFRVKPNWFRREGFLGPEARPQARLDGIVPAELKEHTVVVVSRLRIYVDLRR